MLSESAHRSLLRTAIFVSLLLIPNAASISCKDQTGKDVDWFIMMKMPKMNDSSLPGIAQGYAFYYLDANAKSALQPSATPLSQPSQAIAYTLQQYYDKQNDSSYFHIMYNDEPPVAAGNLSRGERMAMIANNRIPVDASAEKAHSKGVAFFDTTAGFWLVHSVPLFPPVASYQYPTSGTDYAQSAVCLSLPYSQLDKVGTQLLYFWADIYSSYLPASMASANPNLSKAVAGQQPSNSNTTSVIDLKTTGGHSFKSIAKSAAFGQDLYDSLVAPTLKSALEVETWRRGDEVPLDCSTPYVVTDVQYVQVGSTTPYKYTKDHSKWARSTAVAATFCIGDINRMTSQYVRGGGTVCLSDSFVWKALDLVNSTNHC